MNLQNADHLGDFGTFRCWEVPADQIDFSHWRSIDGRCEDRQQPCENDFAPKHHGA